MTELLVLIAIIVEAAFGYPQRLYRAVGHPVGWLGRLLAWTDRRWNTPGATFARRRAWGVAALALTILAAAVASFTATSIANAVLPTTLALVVLGVVGGTLIAQRSLDDHVRAVAEALETGTPEDARHAVAHIVGRETANLETHGLSRAAIESLSENFSDGVVAPVFWMIVGGLPGAAVYKAINTADSMIGHKSERHRAFGWAAARLDDLVNLPASRLAALWIATAAAILPGTSGRAALKSAIRDAHRHRSPNAGWPEAAMAGALGLKLAGPRTYNGETVDDAWIGDGRAEATATDIRNALRIYRTACAIQAAAVGILAAAVLYAASRAVT